VVDELAKRGPAGGDDVGNATSSSTVQVHKPKPKPKP